MLPKNFALPVINNGEDYFLKKNYLSNSYLTELQFKLLGKEKPRPPKKVFEFGSRFDLLITQNVSPRESYLIKMFHVEQMQKMQELFENHPITQGVKEFQREVYNDDFLGLKAKCKIDVFMPELNIIIDIKTTTCLSFDVFKSKKLIQYNYLRAGAWYLDVAKAKEYHLLVFNYTNNFKTSKNFCHEVWHIEFNKYMLDFGRMQYLNIIKGAKKRGLL